MRILFLSYWSFADALTTATVLPHLQLLQERDDVEAIRLVTIERGESARKPPVLDVPFEITKISFQPLLSVPGHSVMVTKTDDFLRFPKELAEQTIAFKADIIIARGSPAGSLAYLVWKQTKLPFLVESFEPHAEYMREAGVWHRFDPRYIFQHYWENQQKKYAHGLMPVAENYRRQLIIEGVPGRRIVTVPCSVNLSNFAFQPEARERMRQRLGLSANATIGVYVGKFGGIYYDVEAFDLFKEVAAFFGSSFHLLLLSPQPAAELQDKLAAAGLNPKQSSIVYAPFQEVPDYLSAADFAFGLHRPSPYVSPIKIGEYWANGLPVLLTEGVGDDSNIIQQEGGGVVFNLSKPGSVLASLDKLKALLHRPSHRSKIRELAERHRSVARAREAYAAFLDSEDLIIATGS